MGAATGAFLPTSRRRANGLFDTAPRRADLGWFDGGNAGMLARVDLQKPGPDLQSQHSLHIRQKTSWGKHRYRVYLDEEGKPGPLVAYVDEDKKAIKDNGFLYRDERCDEVLARFRARKLIDVAAAFDVETPDGTPIGSFQRQVKRSFYRSTYTLEQVDRPPIIVSERNKVVAILRRLWTLLPAVGDFPFPVRYNFDFVRDGVVVGGVERTGRLADNYLAWTDDAWLDRRLLIVMGAALDFRQGR